MQIHFDPDDYEMVGDRRVCSWHQKHPGQPYAGCTCSFSSGLQLRSPEDRARVKAEKIRAEEDRILALADKIRAARVPVA